MMHHPNMHHQPMSGHPQHMPAHQGMPPHHQMQQHQMHRENRHVTLTRVPLGPSQPGGGMGAHAHAHGHGHTHAHGHAQGMGGMGGMGAPPPHHAPQRPPHQIRAMPHHPQVQHHSLTPQQIKPFRRQYVGGAYGASVMPPPYVRPERAPEPAQPSHAVGLCRPASPVLPPPPAKITSDFVVPTSATNTSSAPAPAAAPLAECGAGEVAVSVAAEVSEGGARAGGAEAGAGDGEAGRAPSAQANSKEKTPMCLVNELARYNKIKHQYRLTSETGPAHKKVFTVTLRLGDTEEYTAEGSSIKRAQHAAANQALTETEFPQPPPRAPPAHALAHHHHRHSGAVMPTVELNALAMKLCQPAVYTSVPPVQAPLRAPRGRLPAPPPYRPHPPFVPNAYQRMLPPGLLYRVRVMVGGRAWLGEGTTPQGARHDAAARALQDLRPAAPAGPPPAASQPTAAHTQPDEENGDVDDLLSDVKSPVSLVHELALKRGLSVQFTVKSERGPPHMRVFITTCTVGDMETEGEGNGKKVSKRRAAERMLEEVRRRWPPALLRARPPQDKRKPQPAKKKPRNLIKEGVGGENGEGANGASGAASGADNPISRLAVARHAARARSPQYRVVEERGQARRREFLVECAAPPHCATGVGPNKKTAKRRAAHNVLLAMDSTNSVESPASPAHSAADTNGTADVSQSSGGDIKRKDGEAAAGVAGGGGHGDVRQPVPGVLLMDYQQRSGQPPHTNGVSEASAASGGAGGSTPGARDQLMYLSQLLGFTVQFSDFPKRNHGEYLSLVSLSTEPPVMCHGGGPSTAHSHEQCSRSALRALALMGLDAPTTGMQGMPGPPKAGVVSNGITE